MHIANISIVNSDSTAKSVYQESRQIFSVNLNSWLYQLCDYRSYLMLFFHWFENEGDGIGDQILPEDF